uniref:Uncharacterized protein n=1 Tax=Arundo donax TaxID=35708 RepID=A0A0A9H1F2_ARUDO
MIKHILKSCLSCTESSQEFGSQLRNFGGVKISNYLQQWNISQK